MHALSIKTDFFVVFFGGGVVAIVGGHGLVLVLVLFACSVCFCCFFSLEYALIMIFDSQTRQDVLDRGTA